MDRNSAFRDGTGGGFVGVGGWGVVREKENHYPWMERKMVRFSLSFLSLIVWISLVNFKQGFSLVIWVFSLFFQGFRGFGRGGKSLVNLGFSLVKTEQSRKGRTELVSLTRLGRFGRRDL